ncbi:hypothetical protein EVJ58_g10656, partial [Rhodofomes roseus]
MSSTTAYLRASTPQWESAALAQGVVPSGDALVDKATASRLHRQSLLGAANSVDDVVALVPRDYRDQLRPLLLEAAGTQSKICTADQVLKRLEDHKSRGTLPQHLRSKVPPLQFSKEYAETEAGASARSAATAAHKLFVDTLLQNAIASKGDEARYLRESLLVEKVVTKTTSVVNARYTALGQRGRVPTFSRTVSDDGTVTTTMTGFVENPINAQLHIQVLEDCASYIERVRLIVESRFEAEALKLAKKKEVVHAADKMAVDDDSTPSTSSGANIDKLVAQRVKQEVKKALQASAVAKGGKKSGGSSKKRTDPKGSQQKKNGKKPSAKSSPPAK